MQMNFIIRLDLPAYIKGLLSVRLTLREDVLESQSTQIQRRNKEDEPYL